MKAGKIIKEMLEKNSINLDEYSEWFLDSPTDFLYPCVIYGCDDYYNLEKLPEEKFEFYYWTEAMEGEEVNSKIYYFQIPVLKQV